MSVEQIFQSKWGMGQMLKSECTVDERSRREVLSA